ncbi:N4 gp53-like protein [Sulfitobacter phage EE36phi1]|uniref:N4 gp53-like protein n=1 Tax=Sulfitobacter phage EE36phi1 TaxID=490913 RepID=C4NTF9_9CAUD|nr:virion structural protein [Sulfitobacter phage EE36phi1]ACL81425.1 N4 gp53-like protein [Sulfitobacter phage EE36phi1]
MPHPPLYPWGQDDDRTRSIDVVHIEPSIREGVHLVSSLYGREASSPLYRFPPVSSNNAWIRGDALIPAVLTAEEGTWNASPSATFEYQWMANGIDIPFATQKTWLSSIEYDGQDITVEIKGINYLGQDITITSPLRISIIEPIVVNEQENFLITGLQSGTNAQVTYDQRTLITTGIGALDRIDVNRAVAYYLTGISTDDRLDTNQMSMHFITGLQRVDTLSVQDAGSIAVINMQYADPLEEGLPVHMNLKNPDAEMGMLGWTNFGSVQFDSDAERSGDYSWNGGDNVGPSGSNTPFSYIWQNVPIEAAWIPDVDLGLTNLEVYWYQFTDDGTDMANVRVEYFDVNMTLLGQDNGPGLWASPSNIWFYRTFENPIPANTRWVRIYLEFNLQSGNNNNAAIDDVSMYIRKGAKVNKRDFGPLFEQWRLRFTKANTWSGTGLSEIEFRPTPSGTDLTTGGSPIFGSAGLGVLNADYAFDDLRNTGYWAGEENGIANGTAWVGYDMGTPVRPEIVDITARSGSDSLQVGREFYIEGSNDGIRWTPVQFFREELVGTFTSGQRKQYTIPRGAFDWFTAYFSGAGYLYERSTTVSDDMAGKGNIWICETRLNIDELRVLVDDNQLTPFNYRLQLCRINYQKNGVFQPGMISEVLKDFTLSSAGLNAGPTWVSQACTTSHEFEVGESFLIRFFDLNAATNPVQANEGRTRYITFNGEQNEYMIRNGIARRIAAWAGGPATPEIGQINPNGSSNGTRYFTLDFKGSIY